MTDTEFSAFAVIGSILLAILLIITVHLCNVTKIQEEILTNHTILLEDITKVITEGE